MKLCGSLRIAALLLCAVGAAQAHNGDMAQALPVDGIVIDGDLSDWPEGLPEQPIRRAAHGSAPLSPADLTAAFRIAYSTDGYLYVAIVVQDESVLVDTLTYSDSDTRDGCEVYLIARHGGSGLVAQYSLYGDQRRTYGVGRLDDAEIVATRGPEGHIYEWRIHMPFTEDVLGADLVVLGFDVVITDVDADGTYSWVSWGRGTSKVSSPDRTGDLILATGHLAWGRLDGSVEWQSSGRPVQGGRIGVTHETVDALNFVAITDRSGRFGINLPPGAFVASVLRPGRGEQISQPVRIAPGKRERLRLTVSGPLGERRPRPPLTGRFRQYGIPDGLPSLLVFEICTSSDGSTWFGTDVGLCRFDGRRFQTIRDEGGPAGKMVVEILETRDGALWLGGQGFLRWSGGRFTSFNEENGLRAPFAAGIAEDALGNLWIANGPPGDWSYGIFDEDGFHDVGAPHVQLFQVSTPLLAQSNGTLWAAGPESPLRWTGERFIDPTPSSIVVPEPLALYEGRDGVLWFGGSSTLGRFDGQTWRAFGPEDGVPIGSITSIAQDGLDGALWFTSLSDSAYLMQYADGRFTAIDGDGQFRPDRGPIAVADDDQGGLWIGTWGQGVFHYARQPFTRYDVADVLPSSRVSDLMLADDGGLWIGTEGGLSHFDGENFTVYTQADGLPSNLVVRLAQDRHGTIWVATDFGVCTFDGQEFSCWSERPELPMTWVTDLLCAPDGSVWISGSDGLARFEKDRFAGVTAGENASVYHVAHDSSGGLWLSTLVEGLLRRAVGRTTQVAGLQELGQYVDVLSTDHQGRVWVGSRRDGVGVIDGDSTWTLTTADGLAHDQISALYEDRSGRMWIGTRGAGLDVYDGQLIGHFGLEDGLGDLTVTDVVEDTEGDLWIATEAGVTRMSRDSAPTIRIEDVMADQSYGPVSQVEIPSSQRYLAFEFSTFSHKSRPEQMQYLYRFVGQHDDWRVTRDTQVEYLSLAAGDYTFEVVAVDRELNRSEVPATVAVTVVYEPMSASVRIVDPQIEDVFASFYKTYSNAVGSVTVVNDDPNPVDAEVSFYIPDVMRRPTHKLVQLEPGSSQRVQLSAVLDESVLDLEGSRPVQAEITLSCEIGERIISVTEPYDLLLHGRGALTWDDLGRAAAFITPEEGTVSRFARGLIEVFGPMLGDRRVDGNLPAAMLMFEALNAHGIRYAKDASTPYSQVRGDHLAVDHIQYPVELLQSRMGDCDDCTVLYCALLENLNIPTALIDAPDHILMMFDTGVSAERYAFGFRLEPDLYVVRDDHFWIPVELTVLGEAGFQRAWDLGAKTVQRLQAQSGLRVTKVRDVWPRFPYAIPKGASDLKHPDGDHIERGLLTSLTQLERLRTGYVERHYVRHLVEQPHDEGRRLDLARTQIESEAYTDAISNLSMLLKSEHAAEARYLTGYAFAGLEDLDRAVKYVAEATDLAPENMGYARSLEILKAARAASPVE